MYCMRSLAIILLLKCRNCVEIIILQFLDVRAIRVIGMLDKLICIDTNEVIYS